MKRLLTAYAIATAGCLIGVTPASAADDLTAGKANLCVTEESCKKLKVSNYSGGLVTAVNITRKSTGGACVKKKQHIKKNLVGGMGSMGQSYDVYVDRNCNFKVQSITTSGCSGDKSEGLTIDDLKSAGEVYLAGACGSLHTETDW